MIKIFGSKSITKELTNEWKRLGRTDFQGKKAFIRSLYGDGWTQKELSWFIGDQSIRRYLDDLYRPLKKDKQKMPDAAGLVMLQGAPVEYIARNRDVKLQTIMPAVKHAPPQKIHKKLHKRDNEAAKGRRQVGALQKPIVPITKRPCFITPAIDAVINLSYRREKFQIRRWIIDKSDVLLNSISALTFPGSEWLMERDLALKCGEKVKRITGLEKDRNIYEFSKCNLPPLQNVEFLNASDAEMFAMPSIAPYNLLWLDYMGPFSLNRIRNFRLALENGYVDNDALVCLTFLNGRERKEMVETYNKYANKAIPSGGGRYNDARLKVIPRKYASAAKGFGYKTKLLGAYGYCERQGGVAKSPMLFVALFMSKNGSAPVFKDLHSPLNWREEETLPAVSIRLTERDVKILKLLPASFKDVLPASDMTIGCLTKRLYRLRIRDLIVSEKVGNSSAKVKTIYSLTPTGKETLENMEV